MDNLVVCKFGGSVLAKPEDIAKINYIVQDNKDRKIIVVSAPGKRSPSDVKVTSLLKELTKNKDESLKAQILDRYRSLWPSADLDELAELLEYRLSQNLSGEEYLASVKSFGEDASARVIAKAIGADLIDPRDLFLLSSDYSKAKIFKESEDMIRKSFTDIKSMVIVPGFYGYTREGKIATFDKGGSDLTAAYIAAALNADIYENFKETDGIYAASPGLIANPRKIDVLTFNELRDLAYSGFDVFFDEAINPVRKKKIPVHVRNMFTYPSEGTLIVTDRLSDPERPIVGVAYKGGLCAFNYVCFGLNSMYGIGKKMLQIFEDEKVSVEFITTGIDDMSVIFREEQIAAPNKIDRIIKKLDSLTEDPVTEFQDNLGSLVVAGKGLKGNRGLAANIQGTLADANVNIRFISTGPLERCIVYGIDHSDCKKAVFAVYNRYLI